MQDFTVTEEQTDQALEAVKETKRKGDELIRNIEQGYLNSDQVNMLYDIVTLIHKHANKSTLLTLAGVSEDDQRKIDSAYPIEYYRRVEEIYPPIKDQILVYAYHEDRHGSLFNVGNAITKRLLKVFS